MNRIIIFAVVFILSFSAYSQNNWNGTQLVIQNEKIQRIVVLENGVFTTQSYRLKDYPYNFVSTEKEEPVAFNQQGVGNIQEYRRYRGANPEEFSFLLNEKKVTGKTGWLFVSLNENESDGTFTFEISLKGNTEINRDIELTISYVVYPNLPIIRKKIDIKNIGTDEFKIESPDVESLNIPWGNTHNIIYQNYRF